MEKFTNMCTNYNHYGVIEIHAVKEIHKKIYIGSVHHSLNLLLRNFFNYNILFSNSTTSQVFTLASCKYCFPSEKLYKI